MSIGVFILGNSGTGKTTSLRNFKSDEILYINVAKKPLPFRAAFSETVEGDSYVQIAKAINNTKKKAVVIDDCQYLMANEFMRRSSEKGYDKFTEIAKNFWTLVNASNNDLAKDVIIYFLAHTDVSETGQEKMKTIGKMLDEKICVEGMVSIVLKTSVKDGHYTFCTQNNGHDTVKSPLGMFDSYEIDNDLKAVDTTIREYWGLTGDTDLAAIHDTAVDNGGVSTDAPKRESRRERRRERQEVKDVERSVEKGEFVDITPAPTSDWTASSAPWGATPPPVPPPPVTVDTSTGDVVEKTPTVGDTVVTKRRERKKRNAEQLDADAKQLINNNAEPNPEADAEGIIAGDTVPF